ncbi:MAG TPA: alanine racemase [Candidatus Angelobacter sp.]|nr:alanine racemase [Candidatus Angelobacter sp.]
MTNSGNSPHTATAPAIVGVREAAHPCWVEVSLTALRHNFRTLQSFVQPEAVVCAVIKSDAYGHGAAACALALEKEGASWFAVNTAAEAVALRERGIPGRILLLGGLWGGDEDAIVKHDLSPAIWDWNQIELLEKAAEKLKPQRPIRIHLKVNTGMNRLGVDAKDLPEIYEALRAAPHLRFEGIFSHFASSEVVDLPQGEEQLARFQRAVAQAQSAGLTPLLKHMANSAAIAARPKSWFNMVRPGLALYGYFLPFMSVLTGQPDTSLTLPVKPALTWKARLLQVREVQARQAIGYNSGFVTEVPMRVAVLPVGYGDGLSRQLSSRGRVIVRDEYARIIGNISMNLTTVDVTGIPGVEVGDEVTIIGETASRKITAWEHAGLASTIPYEILCNISGRLPRKYSE